MDSDLSPISEREVLHEVIPLYGAVRSALRLKRGEPCILNCVATRGDAAKYIGYQIVSSIGAIVAIGTGLDALIG